MAFYQGDALTEIKKIKPTADGHIDYDTLPAFARKVVKVGVFEDREIVKDGKSIVEKVKVGEVDEPRRDLGAMISMLTVAVQQLTARIEKLEKK